MSKDAGRIFVIGAGPMGIGAAYRLKSLRCTNFRGVKASESACGLASSFVDRNGFPWDIGGHVQFSHCAYFDDAMDAAPGKEGRLHRERGSWVRIADNSRACDCEAPYVARQDGSRAVTAHRSQPKRRGCWASDQDRFCACLKNPNARSRMRREIKKYPPR